MKKYSWTKKYAVDAQVVGEILESLPAKNEEELLKAARAKRSPIHHLFEWDQTRAAQEYRLLQARVMLSSLHVEIVSVQNKPVSVKAYIKESNKSGNYVHVAEASDDDLSAEEAKCLRQMKRFKSEWSHISIARNVIAEIRSVELSVSRRSKKRRAA